MLNYIWAFMILIGIIYGSFTGHMADLSNAALDSAKEAVTLCITMLGIMSFWVGLMQIAQKAGIVSAMTKKLRPVLLFLFPTLHGEDRAMEYISTNVIANILGLGWACTPAGLKAMEELSLLEERRREEALAISAADRASFTHARPRKTEQTHCSAPRTRGKTYLSAPRAQKKGCASNEMCNFLILNISSLQLIPVNMLVYRSQYGSVNPSSIILPAILATTCSTAAGIVFLKLADAKTRR